MKTWYSSTSHSHCHPCHSTSYSLNETAASLQLAASHEHNNYLSHLNYKLINEINDVQTQKHFYRNKLSNQYRCHTSELDEAFRIINQKNNIILELQQAVDRLKKQFRTVEDQYLCAKNNNIADKEYFKKEIQNMQNKCRKKIADNQEKIQKQCELKMNRRIDEINKQCEDRVKLFQDQINKLTQNSTQLAHELKLMQDTHRDVLLKNDLLIQQSINRQLRKRDYEAQNNYLRDVNQYQNLLKEKRGLKDDLQDMESKLKLTKAKNNQLQAQLQVQKTMYQDLVKALEHQKMQKKQIQNKNSNNLSNNSLHFFTSEADTNTEQPFVPVVMPVDIDLISQIKGLKQFVVEKIVELYLDFFQKTAVTDPKKKSLSLTTFKSSFQLLKQTNPDHKILLYIQSNLDRIIRLYCPAMTYTRQYLTIKDDFIKKTLMQCETIANPYQKLYRILQLINRLKHPITHTKSQISPGELRMVQMKMLAALKKAIRQ